MPGDSLQPQIIAINFIFMGAATITTGLRFWSRALMHQFGADDWLVGAAWALSIAQTGIALKLTYLTGQGYRIADLPPPTLEDMIYSSKLAFATGLIYNPILGLVKAAIILFLLRLGDVRRGIVWSLWGLFAFNIGHVISVFLVVVFQCTPVHMYWDHYKTDIILEDGTPYNPNYKCIDQAAFSVGTAGIAVATDIAILMVPVFIMWNLRMPLRRKLAVLLVLSCGWVVAVVGAIRIKFFVDMWYGNFADPSYNLWSTLSGIENNVAIMVASGPALKALITRFSPKFFGTTYATRPSGPVAYTPKSYEMHSRDRTKRSAHTSERSRGPRDFGDTGSQEAIVKSVSVEIKDGAATDSDERLGGWSGHNGNWESQVPRNGQALSPSRSVRNSSFGRML